ncbi:hypothetical protein LWI29_036096 [Acer saccharum]|uniref:Uncharacterized protein n=1 Tax=Acer saccharum TaxID=4024 RepID=A0AA39RTX3_ACESA|nr:hypothetical protein LWI29_036096 [Acer saccharum]
MNEISSMRNEEISYLTDTNGGDDLLDKGGKLSSILKTKVLPSSSSSASTALCFGAKVDPIFTVFGGFPSLTTTSSNSSASPPFSSSGISSSNVSSSTSSYLVALPRCSPFGSGNAALTLRPACCRMPFASDSPWSLSVVI